MGRCGLRQEIQTYDPYTGEPWALIPECDKADADRAVEAAARAFESGPWPQMTPTARGKVMRRIAQLIEKHADHLGQVEVRDNGKLISEMVAQTKYMPEWFDHYGGLADKIQGAVVPVDRPDHFTYILKEPVGVCAFITPWNSPLMLTAWKLAPALAAGCTVVIKPSEFTSASLLEFMKLVIEELGLPPGVVNVVTGDGAVVGEPLVTHPKVAKVAFTGGTAMGARVNELAAKSFKKVSLELGGKSPNIVSPHQRRHAVGAPVLFVCRWGDGHGNTLVCGRSTGKGSPLVVATGVASAGCFSRSRPVCCDALWPPPTPHRPTSVPVWWPWAPTAT